MENHSAGEVIGSKDAPYATALARACATAANYTEIRSPSLPNFIAATSGGTWGIGDDDSPSAHPLEAVSIYEQAPSWREYEEDAPGACPSSDEGNYAQRHDPALYYTRIAAQCSRFDIPLGDSTSGSLARDLRDNTVPAFAMVTPNLQHDMHDGSVASADEWLAEWLPLIFASRAYTSGTTAVFVIWDESDSSEHPELPFIAAAKALIPGTVLNGPMNHYGLLCVTEALLGLPLLNNAKRASTAGLEQALGVH